MVETISSTFDTGTDGWTVIGDVAASGWRPTGGEPGGFLGWIDAATGADSYYQAPEAFLGNEGAFYGGTLSYDVIDTGNGYSAYDVSLTAGQTTLEYTSPNDGSFPTPRVWSAASVSLVAGNFLDSATGEPPSVAEMKMVLSHLSALDIRAEYVEGAEKGGLDDVYLTAPSPAAPAGSFTDAVSTAHETAGGAGSDGLAGAGHSLLAALG